MAFLFFYIAVICLCLGSFANVCIHRIPRDESIVRPRSRCPACLTTLPWKHNVPILSYMVLRGRCGFCASPISIRYPLVEFGVAVTLLITILRDRGHPVTAVSGALLAFYLWIISAIDGEHGIIPDELSYSLLTLGLISAPWNVHLGSDLIQRGLQSLIGGAAGFGLMVAISVLGKAMFRKEALGGGDVKLMAALGAFLGYKGVFATLFLGSMAGTLWTVVLLLLRKAGRGSYIPFGPFLAFGAWLSWLKIGFPFP
jgi:leader peptidase (prepilin peptidase) / N-methyltransferase